MLAERIRWRVNRLRCMAPAEVRHRVLQTLKMRAQRLGLKNDAPVPAPDSGQRGNPWLRNDARVDAAPYLAAAERVACGRFDLFALRDAALGSPPDWNRDPKTGIEVPLQPGERIDYRDPRRVGDVKYLWELNRHLHLVTLAQACALGGGARFRDAIRRHLESWFAQCPYGLGANWTSALEAALRLINWSATWQLLGGAAAPIFEGAGGARFRRRWLGSVYRHAQFIRQRFSLYSSANNHLIGEAAGLFVAALSWPCWPQARGWLREAHAILEREALLQNAADGVNREQAVSYQQFVLDLLLVALLAGKANGIEFSPAVAARIEAMLEFLASLMDAGGNVPMIGDSDDGCVLRLAQGGAFCPYRSLLASGAILFRRGEFKAKAGALDDKTRWLIGSGADAAYAQLEAGGTKLPVRREFAEGGYRVLGCELETLREIRLVADAGPVGYLSIAAHGHADALSFTLSVGGREFLVDPGTYAYHAQSRWRSYFRGTAAHNTLRVDGADQSQSGGSFLWLRKASTRCTLWQSTEERDVFEASHDGYARLRDPVVHSRRIALEKRLRRVVIEDRLQMKGAHEIELFFHFAEHCEVEADPEGIRVRRAGSTLLLTLPQIAGAATEIVRGSAEPVLGWISRRYDEKEPAPTIVWRARLSGDALLRSEIAC
jgi:hypothetical protein